MSYIWQNNDWPCFVWDSSCVQDALIMVEREKEKADYAYSIIGSDVYDNILSRVITEDTVSSLSIEGEKIDYNEVYSCVRKQLFSDSFEKGRTSSYAESVVRVVNDAVRNHSAMTHERLFEWNRNIFINKAGIKPKIIGAYRTAPEYVMRYRKMEGDVIYEAVSADRVQSEMERLLSYINTDDDNVFVAAAVSSLWFVLIHPFEDGNGRISRALADYIISRDEGWKELYKTSPVILKRKSEYYDEIERVASSNTLDITNWLIFFLSVINESIVTSMDVLRKTLRTTTLMKSLDPNEYNSREMSMLYTLSDGSFYGKLTTEKWAKMMKCSSTVAYRDIQHLVKRGFLIPSGDGGRSTGYYFNPDNSSF